MLPDGSRGKKKKPAIAFRPADLLPPGWVKLITSVHVLEGYNGRGNPGRDPSIKAPALKAAAAPSGGHEPSAKVNYVITLNGEEHRVTVAPEQWKQIHIHTD